MIDEETKFYLGFDSQCLTFASLNVTINDKTMPRWRREGAPYMAESLVDDPLWKLHIRKIVEAILA